LIEINSVYKQLFGPDGTLRKDVRYFEIYGGRRSAKSHEVAAILGITAMTEPGHFIPCMRKVGTTLKDSVFAEIIGFFKNNNIKHTVNKTDKELWLPNDSRFRCFGLDDPEKLKSLKDATLMWHEECNEEAEEDFDSLDAGLSPSKYPGRHIITHNPFPQIPGSLHWIQRRFLQVPHELSKAVIDTKTNALILRTWYKDNRFCPPETIKVLEGYKETNPEKYKLWALGEFTKLEGVVFDNWNIVPCVPEGIIHDSIGVGLDFGFASDQSGAVRVWINGNDLYVQQLVYKTGLLPEMLYNELKESGVTEFENVVADSSRPDTIEFLKQRGLKGIHGVKKHPGYKEETAMKIKEYKIHIIEGSTDLIREISTYSWMRDKNGKQLPKLQDGDDHLLDPLTMVMSEIGKKQEFAFAFI
jgi:phage terminase large subunit